MGVQTRKMVHVKTAAPTRTRSQCVCGSRKGTHETLLVHLIITLSFARVPVVIPVARGDPVKPCAGSSLVFFFAPNGPTLVCTLSFLALQQVRPPKDFASGTA